MAQPEDSAARAPSRTGRYSLHGEIASGGMATVYYGQMSGAHGFSRVVAVKRMLPRMARDPRFHAMFVDEARLASRVQHPNVVPILDVVDEDGEVMIVMEYVRGPSLSALLETLRRAEARTPVAIAANMGCGILAGLHAAHEARDRRGKLLGIVHRDVSPQNVLVGVDGVTRIMDFGVAKATQLGAADDGTLTGKLCYMAPEQFEGTGVDRRTDVFATGAVLWGALAGRRLFRAESIGAAMQEVRRYEIPPLAEVRDDVPPELERVIHQALHPDRERRFETAEAFAVAIEEATSVASPRAVADWVGKLAGTLVNERDAVVLQIEKTRTTMSISTGGAAQDADPVRSDVITAEWVKSPEPALAPAPDVAVSARPRRLGRFGVALAAVAVLATGGLWLSSREPSAAPPAAASVVPESAPSPTTEPKVLPELDADTTPSAAPATSATAPRARARPRPPATSTAPAPKPATTRGREPYLPSSPFGN